MEVIPADSLQSFHTPIATGPGEPRYARVRTKYAMGTQMRLFNNTQPPVT